MIIVLFFTCLILTPSLTHPADDALSPLAQSVELLQPREPETPEEFMLQLRRAESALQQASNENDPFQLFGKKHSNLLRCYNENYQQESLQATKTFMQEIGCAEFHDYFIALASSSLPNKTEDVFVKIPYFKKLAYTSQEEVDHAFSHYNKLENEATYPINRLFLAAFLGASIDVNKRYTYGYPAAPVLWANDIELLKKLLHYSLNVNIGTRLSDCTSLQAAQLLLMHGADFDKQHNEDDLINYQCCFMGTCHNNNLLALFLPYVPLDKTNQFGKKWFNSLIKEQHFFAMETFIERIAILLQHGCHYNQEQANRIITARDTKKLTPEQRYYKMRTSQLFKQAETSRKNVVFGLQQRALTGKPFGYKRAPQT